MSASVVPATREQVARFKALLKERGMSMQELARVAMVGRCHLSGVIHGKRHSGTFSRPRVAAHLTGAELEALGWATSVEATGPNVLTDLPGAGGSGGRSQSGPYPARAAKVMESACQCEGEQEPRRTASVKEQGSIRQVFKGKTILDLEREGKVST